MRDLWSKDGASAGQANSEQQRKHPSQDLSSELVASQLPEEQATGESAMQVVQGTSNQVSNTEAVNPNVVTLTEPLPPSAPRDDGALGASGA